MTKEEMGESVRSGSGPEPERPLYVGEDGRVLTADAARRALAGSGDFDFVQDSLGVVRVTRERWNAAQRYERNVWMNLAAHAEDDRNLDHAESFDRYRALAGRRFEKAIELGCGPFTNLRLIARECEIRACTLLDPLLEDYQRHRHCTYRHGFLALGESKLGRLLGAGLPGRALRKLLRGIRPSFVLNGVPVSERLALPIEDLAGERSYDLVVMINVLEHCFDAPAIFSQVQRISPPGSILVFHDKLYSASRVASLARERFDTGHPLRVDAKLVLEFLADGFRPLFERRARLRDVHDDVDLSEDAIYFIGERK